MKLPADTDHEWSHLTGVCRLCGEGMLHAGAACLGSAAEPEDAWEALRLTLAAIERYPSASRTSASAAASRRPVT